MSERYSRLFSLPENLYAIGSPIIIAAGTLLKDNQTGRIVAQLKLKSISNKVIKAVKVKLDLFDTAGNALDESVVYDYLDLNVTRDVEFGQKNPVIVPDIKARSYMVSVTEVVFADRSVWTADGGSWEQLRKPSRLAFDNYELQKQYEIKFGGGSLYEAKRDKDLWYCTCGAINHDGEMCHICHNTLLALQSVDMSELEIEKNARLEEKARVNAERAIQAAEEQAARKAAAKEIQRKIIRFSAIAFAVVAVALLATKVVIPNHKYKDAVSLMEAGRYVEAIDAFHALGEYKDAPQMLERAKDHKNQEEQEAVYQEAVAQMNVGNYDDAVILFTRIITYKDSGEKKRSCLEISDLAKYAEAEHLLESGDIARAAIAFGKLEDYQDSRERSFALWKQVIKENTIVASSSHTVGIKRDGTVVAVGSNADGRCNVSHWENIIAISSINDHVVGLKDNGTVVALGGNDYRQCSVSGWKDIFAIATGAGHTIGLKNNGTVVAVGYNDDDRCNVSKWKNIVDIAAGYYHTVGLTDDGTVVTTGTNNEGQCNVSTWRDITEIFAGGWHTVGLRADGTAIAVGCNDNGRCDVSDWSDIVSIAAGRYHTVGLKSDGTVVAVGQSSEGQCDVSDWKDIVSISAGAYHTVGLKSDGTVVAVGWNKYGQCNVSNWKDIKLPK